MLNQYGDAEEKIKQMKRKYFDARHNCYAYSIYNENAIVIKCSDDGEPSGTAGAPILKIINSEGISNVLVVVTRYFGGILLGTGGLVKAYTLATQEALNKVEIIKKELGKEINVEVSYADFEKAKYYMKKNNINIVNCYYNENVNLFLDITNEKLEKLRNIDEKLNFEIINIRIVKEEKYIEKIES